MPAAIKPGLTERIRSDPPVHYKDRRAAEYGRHRGVVNGVSILVSNSAHEPQNAFVDFQQLAHLEVHGRNARKKFGVVSFCARNRLKPGLQTVLGSGWLGLESRL
jgi:hypothetical protein